MRKLKLKLKLNGVINLFLVFFVSVGCIESISSFKGTSPDAKFLRKKRGVGENFNCSDQINFSDCVQMKYYNNIDPNKERDSLEKFRSYHGFDSGIPVSANYTNFYDLNLLRDMHCIESIKPNVIACYVTNYQNSKSYHIGDAVATVAMEYDPSDLENTVKFFVYDKSGENLLVDVALDSEGPKTVPNVCLNCHGGEYNFENNSVSDARFIMFDYELFTDGGVSLKSQENSIKKLNEMVAKTNLEITAKEIALNYSKGNYDVTPDDWTENKELYHNVVKPFCRGCHYSFSADTKQGFGTFEDFKTYSGYINYVVCNTERFSMPHSERTRKIFLESNAKTLLADFLRDNDVDPNEGCL